MRFSPILLAGLAASATLGLTYATEAQAATSVEQDSAVGRSNVTADGIATPTGVLLTSSETQWRVSVNHSEEAPMVLAPERSAVDFFAQAAVEDFATQYQLAQDVPDPVPVAPVEQVPVEQVPVEQVPEAGPPPATETPLQDTPDRLEFELTDPPTPEVEITPPEVDPPVEPVPGEPVPGEPTPGEPIPVEPAPTPPVPPTTQPPAPQEEVRVLVSEVLVLGAEGELLDRVYQAIRTQPGQPTTRSQLQEDINAIFATGFFSNVRAVPEDTPLGVRVTFEVAPNPVLQSVQLSGTVLETLTVDGEEVPVQSAVDEIFAPQYGQILNLRDFQFGIEALNQLYQDSGYVLAQVVGAPQISPSGVVTLEVAEGVIEDIQIRFLDREGQAVDAEGEPIQGRTRDFIITREFESQPGDVFNQQQIQADLQRAFALGIFEDLSISLNPGQDPRQVDVVVNVTERNTGSFAAGLGISSASGLFGTVSLQEQNLGGNNQRVNAEVQLGQRDLLFDLSFTDPWIGGDPNRTSYTVNAFGRQSRSLVFEGDDDDIRLPNDDRPRVRRFGGGVTFGRPFDNNWFGSAGLQYQRVSIRDLDGEISPISEFGTLLSFDESGQDDLITVQLAANQDLRNSTTQPTSGTALRLSTEQSIPVGNGSILFNRLRASYSYFLPVRLITFTEGCRVEDPLPVQCPQTLAFNIQGGTIIGDLPPYEAFALGGTDSVRGYGAGELSSSRSFIQATAEYRFPIFSIVGGALFVDFGSDLGTDDGVPGNPGQILDKPGTGLGYGAGVRVQSPLGQIRVDFAINDQGDNRIHFGIGERF
jgi:outer membrane protein insertion porin family